MALDQSKNRLIPFTGTGRSVQQRHFELSSPDTLADAMATGYLNNLVNLKKPKESRSLVDGDIVNLRFNFESTTETEGWATLQVSYTDTSGVENYSLITPTNFHNNSGIMTICQRVEFTTAGTASTFPLRLPMGGIIKFIYVGVMETIASTDAATLAVADHTQTNIPGLSVSIPADTSGGASYTATPSSEIIIPHNQDIHVVPAKTTPGGVVSLQIFVEPRFYYDGS